MKDLKPQNLLEGNIGAMLFDRDLSSVFLDISPQARQTTVKISKWDYIKLKAFAQWRKLSTKWKCCLLTEERYFQMVYLVKG